jgi:hypothetical protein
MHIAFIFYSSDNETPFFLFKCFNYSILQLVSSIFVLYNVSFGQKYRSSIEVPTNACSFVVLLIMAMKDLPKINAS